MEYFEKDGDVYKHVPAGGHGGGVTGSAVIKATDAEAAAFRAALEVPDVAAEEAEPQHDETEHSDG